MATIKIIIKKGTEKSTGESHYQIIPIGPYQFLINETNQSLANRAFIKTSADAILFRNPEKLSAGITFRMNSGLNQLTGFKHYLINELLAIEPSWKSIGDNSALIINYGHTSKTPTIITILQIIKIIESIFSMPSVLMFQKVTTPVIPIGQSPGNSTAKLPKHSSLISISLPSFLSWRSSNKNTRNQFHFVLSYPEAPILLFLLSR